MKQAIQGKRGPNRLGDDNFVPNSARATSPLHSRYQNGKGYVGRAPNAIWKSKTEDTCIATTHLLQAVKRATILRCGEGACVVITTFFSPGERGLVLLQQSMRALTDTPTAQRKLWRDDQQQNSGKRPKTHHGRCNEPSTSAAKTPLLVESDQNSKHTNTTLFNRSNVPRHGLTQRHTPADDVLDEGHVARHRPEHRQHVSAWHAIGKKQDAPARACETKKGG